MNHDSTVFVGLDVHKESITVAYAIDMGDVELLGKIGTLKADIVDCASAFSRRRTMSALSMKPAPVATDSTGNSSKEDSTAWYARRP